MVSSVLDEGDNQPPCIPPKRVQRPRLIQRLMLLSAGEGVLVTFHSTASTVSYNLGNIVLVVLSIVMLQDMLFNKVTTFSGLLVGIIGFGIYLPQIGLILGILSVIFLVVYEILIGVRLIKLGQEIMKENA